MANANLDSYRPRQPLPLNLDNITDLPGNAVNAVLFFANYPTLEFVKICGRPGVSGGALLYRERFPHDGAFKRQLIIKYYDNEREISVQDAEIEFRNLSLVRGAEHLLQLLGTGRIAVGDRTCLFMEYLGHGEIADLLDRLKSRNAVVPNRILLSIFLCLARACVGMEYLPRGPPGGPTRRETIPDPPIAPHFKLCHRDLHPGNVVITTGSSPGDLEHRLGPVAKPIDFGFAKLLDKNSVEIEDLDPKYGYDKCFQLDDSDNNDEPDGAAEGIPPDFDASKENIYDIALIVHHLAMGEQTPIMYVAEDIEWHSDLARDVVVNTTMGPRRMATMALEDLNGRRLISTLFHLINWCMAYYQDDRPTLEQVLNLCMEGVLNPPDFQELGGAAIYETDEYVQQFIKDFILNAEVTENEERLRLGRRMTTEGGWAREERKRKRNLSDEQRPGRNVRRRAAEV